MRAFFLAVVFVFGLIAFGSGQQPTPTQKKEEQKKEETKPKVRITLDDGSVIVASIKTSSVSVETAYGLLSVPVSEIIFIKLGNHLSALDAKFLSDALRGVSSHAYAEREKASKQLVKIGRRAIPELERLCLSLDVETKRRAQSALMKIKENDSRPVCVEDVVVAEKMEVRGIIRVECLSFESSVLGKFDVCLPELSSLAVFCEQTFSCTVDANECGDNWCKSAAKVQPDQSIDFVGIGTVDLFPNQPGQYQVDPRGHRTTIGKGGQFRAGSLVAKIGETGQQFYVGEKNRCVVPTGESGNVYLRIVPSPWDNESDGRYAVTIKTGR